MSKINGMDLFWTKQYLLKELSSQKHSQGFVQVPCSGQPGWVWHWSQFGPDHPGVHRHSFGCVLKAKSPISISSWLYNLHRIFNITKNHLKGCNLLYILDNHTMVQAIQDHIGMSKVVHVYRIHFDNLVRAHTHHRILLTNPNYSWEKCKLFKEVKLEMSTFCNITCIHQVIHTFHVDSLFYKQLKCRVIKT